ncbi:hypothetical protein F9K88_11575 [Brucella intermedia]|uniref:hypothetical protein n=1 Tax=Brucella intermedia TaxID=94625 RepID=UPI001322D720|nr:hypothetical protein [Brucella intermedia]KAB2710632.1 hypothetical protein F9K88_11575 [Brucella intermedia]
MAVENSQTDGDLFKEIFNAFCGRHEVRTVRYDLRMGGGSTLDVVVDQCLQRQRITVAICDSDKAYPQASDSDLLSNMIRNANRNNYIGYINSLPCRDIENIIPIDIIFDNRLRPDYNLLFQNILQRIHSDTSLNKTMDWPILYFDMKRGISLARLATLSPLSPEFTWTHENFSLDGTNRLDRDFAGFGPAILADFLSNAKAVSQLANRVRKREWHPKLEELFDILCWYLAGERFQPAI